MSAAPTPPCDGGLRALAPRLDVVAPRLCLADLPAPLIENAALARAAGLASLHVKRDDVTSPVYGGSKVRALEFLLGAARAAGAAGVATLGPDASHHVHATAVFGTAAGFRVRAAVFAHPGSPRDPARLRAWGDRGVELVRAPHAALLPWAAARARWTPLGGGRPYWIAAGGASPLGALGNAEGALEIAADVAAGRLPAPERVVVAAGSCGTAAGLVAGFAAAGLDVEVVAVRTTPRIVASRGRILRLAAGVARILEAAGGEPAERVTRRFRCVVHHAAYGPGYGAASAEVLRAAGVAESCGLRVDPTYTAKAVAALFDPSNAGRRVVWWNTLSAVDP